MKKTIHSQVVLLMSITLLMLNACRKGEFSTTSHPVIARQVNAWLDQQQATAKNATPAKIQTLKSHLNFDKLRIEELRDGEKIVIVPTRGQYAVSNTVPARDNRTTSMNLLLLILDKSGMIRKGNIVQYLPEDPASTEVPDNTFYKIYHHQQLDCDGRFKYLNLDETYLYEFKFSNGAMSSYSFAQSKPKGKIANIDQDPIGPAPICTDWYLVTIDLNTGEVISEEYLFTTCESSGGGGGGGGGNSEEPPVGLTTQVDWTVVQNTSGLWKIVSTERISGIKDANWPGGGHFTAITHLSSALIATSEHQWVESNTVTVGNDGGAVYSYISGVITFPNTSQKFVPTTSHGWTFPEVFP